MLFEQNGMVVRGVGVFAACGHECQDSDYIPRGLGLMRIVNFLINFYASK